MHRIFVYSMDFVSLLIGTGKTLTGIKLILLFTKVNLQFRKDRGEHLQVVYCGPSNKSVDLVARTYHIHILLLSLEQCV